MKKFIIYITILFFPILTIVGIINYTVDPAFVLNADYMSDVTIGLQKGFNVTGFVNLDERIFKRTIANTHSGESIDYLIIGPSQIMTVSKDAFPDTCSILNLGMSACRVEDYIAMYEICKECKVPYSSIIIAIDPSLFNDKCDESRWKSNSLYYSRFFGDSNQCRMTSTIQYIENLFDLPYFQESLKMLVAIGKPKVQYTVELENEFSTYDVCGSLTYGKKYRETPQSETDELASNWEHQTFQDYTEISRNKIKQFEMYISALQSDSVNILFAFCPYHPQFYLRSKSIKGFNDAERYLYDFAKEQDIRILGSYDPEVLHVDRTFFYDAAHMKKHLLNKLIKEEFNTL